MTISEIDKITNYLLDNNLELAKKGQHKISIGLEGAPGIGKTAIVKEIAEKRGAKFVRVELASLEEIGDLCGLPIKQFKITKDGEEIQVAEKLLNEYFAMGWKLCPDCEPTMTYAIPTWVPTDPDQEVILLLDDYTRATSLFMQAIMALVQFGEYISFKLPEKTHLILTSNEDNGLSSITSLDSAQRTRLLNFHIDFDYKQYGKWMDNNGLMSEAINFMLLTPEIFEKSELINARTYTMFTNAISGLKNLDSVETLNMIDLIAKGCFGNDTVIGAMFATFVHNHLDKLISAEEMLEDDWDKISKKIHDNVIHDGKYRADIASVLTMRLSNYVEANVKNSKIFNKAVVRLEQLIENKETLLTEDLIFTLIKKLVNLNSSKCSKLLLNKKVQTKVLGA